MSKLLSFSLMGALVCNAISAKAQEVNGTVPSVNGATDVTSRQRAWLAASPEERVRLSEQLGEEGARKFAAAKGWQPISDGTARVLPQGPDQVYRGAGGTVHVVEAKGGSGQLGHAYGYPQGSPEWATESAKRVLRSASAGPEEKAAAEAVLAAAASGKLEVHVIRTSHVLGDPTAAVLEQTASSAAEGADRAARSADGALVAAEGGSGKVLRVAGKAALPVAVGVDVGLRASRAAQVERDFAAGKITERQRVAAHAANGAGFVGGWSGAWAGAELGAGAGALGGPIGAGIGGVAGGVGGYFGGEALGEKAAENVVGDGHDAKPAEAAVALSGESSLTPALSKRARESD